MENIKTIIIWTTGLLLVFVLIFSLTFWCQSKNILPNPPSLSINGNDSSQALKTKEIANYKELKVIIETQREKTFDLIITKTLLPILTTLIAAIITYILAKASLILFTAYFNSKK